MSENLKLDRRQLRTRNSIREAFRAMLFEIPYSKITVALVAENANVGRSTLYEHYKSKTDLLSDSLVVPMRAVAALIGARDISPEFRFWLQHFYDNRALGRVLFNNSAKAVMLDVLSDENAKRLSALAAKSHFQSVPIKLIASQLAAAQFAILTPWILGQVAISKSTVDELLHQTTYGLVQALFEDVISIKEN